MPAGLAGQAQTLGAARRPLSASPLGSLEEVGLGATIPVIKQTLTISLFCCSCSSLLTTRLVPQRPSDRAEDGDRDVMANTGQSYPFPSPPAGPSTVSCSNNFAV